MEFLPRPEVSRCASDDVAPNLSVLELRWRLDAPGTSERLWHLPRGVSIHSRAPTRFGISVERLGEDAYRVHVLWNQLSFTWNTLTRVQLMASSLSLVMHALGADMWHLLQQPVQTQLAA